MNFAPVVDCARLINFDQMVIFAGLVFLKNQSINNFKKEKNFIIQYETQYEVVRGRTRAEKVVLVLVCFGSTSWYDLVPVRPRTSTTSLEVKWSYLVLTRTLFTFFSVVLVPRTD